MHHDKYLSTKWRSIPKYIRFNIQDHINETQKKQIIDEIHNFLIRQFECNSYTNEEMFEKIQNQRKFYFFDKSMNFYFCKEFHPSIPEKLKNRELEIMKKRVSF